MARLWQFMAVHLLQPKYLGSLFIYIWPLARTASTGKLSVLKKTWNTCEWFCSRYFMFFSNQNATRWPFLHSVSRITKSNATNMSSILPSSTASFSKDYRTAVLEWQPCSKTWLHWYCRHFVPTNCSFWDFVCHRHLPTVLAKIILLNKSFLHFVHPLTFYV